jgi:GntR family transcriptional regulator
MTQPLYIQVKNEILKSIEQQEPNTPILSERELAEKHDVSRMTARKAIRKLVDEGYLYRKDNLGTFVADPSMRKKFNVFSFLDFKNNEAPSYKIIHFQVISGDDKVAKKLNIDSEKRYMQIIRKNMNDGKPASIEEIYINPSIVSKETNDIEEILDFHSLIKIGVVKQTFIPAIVPVEYAHLLKLQINTPIIKVESIVTTQEGQIFAYSRTYVNSNENTIEIIR